MGTLKVNGDITATGIMSATSGFIGNASTSSIPLGFSYREASWSWGTLTAANGYTLLTDWITPAQGGLAFADKGTQVSCQIDGYFYQDEGRYIVLDANNYTSYAPTKTGSGASGTWSINITGNAATASSASSASLLSIHNTITNTSTRSVAASSWTGSVSGLKYVWGEAFKDTSLGSDTGDLVLGLRAGQYASGGTELCMMIDGDYYSMGNKVLHAGNYNNYAPTKTGTGASGTWGINITGSAGYADGSNYAYRFNNRGVIDNITTAATTGSMVYDYNVLGDTPGLFPVWHNANAILTLNKHGGNYDSQLGFSSNGRLYYRSFSGQALDATTGWNTVAWTSDLSSYLPLSGGTVNGTVIATGDPAFYAPVGAGSWAYLRLVSGGNLWDIAVNSSQNGGALDFRPGGQYVGCCISPSGHLTAISGITWNHAYWLPNANIYCQPTGNGQEWSFDVGASGYTGCFWHVWSAKNGCSMLRCDADTNAVGIPNGPLYLGTSCYGPNLPGASYVGQIFFQT